MTLNRRDLFRFPFAAAGGAADARGRPRPAPGSAPGVLHSEPGAEPPAVQVMAYGPLELTESPVRDLDLLRQMRGKWPVVWVNVDGVGHAPTLAAIGEIFGLHGLALEALGDVQQRSKVEPYDDQLLFITRAARLTPVLDLDQVGVFLGRDFVVTFQERPSDLLDPVRERIRAGRGRIRQAGADYLAYAVVDTVVDHYFPVADAFADRLDALEDEVVRRPDAAVMARLHDVKRELMTLRRAVWPLRDALHALSSEPGALISRETLVYLRDTSDHCFQVLDAVDTYRDLGASLTDLYLGTVSNRMNEIMKAVSYTHLTLPTTERV